MTIKEAAIKFGVSSSLVYQWVVDDKINYQIIDRHVDIPEISERPISRRRGRKAKRRNNVEKLFTRKDISNDI